MPHVLDDLLPAGLKLVICGTAASRRSAVLGHYYAGQGNKFWKILAEVGLTDRQLAPAEYQLLSGFGIGLTDIAKSQSGGDHQIRFAESHRDRLHAEIERCQPRYLCFNGKRAAKEYFRVSEIGFGLQPHTIRATRIFVAPSTSAAANATWDSKIWLQLATYVNLAQAAT